MKVASVISVVVTVIGSVIPADDQHGRVGVRVEVKESPPKGNHHVKIVDRYIQLCGTVKDLLHNHVSPGTASFEEPPRVALESTVVGSGNL